MILLLKIVGTLFIAFGTGAVVSIRLSSDKWFSRFMGAYASLFVLTVLYGIWVLAP